MDAEEKKLSPNPEGGHYEKRPAGLKLHYFPDIPVDDPDHARVCVPLEDKFERLRYNDGAPNCSNLSSESADEITRARAKSFPVDGSQAQAYQKGFKDGVEKGIVDGQKTGFDLAAQQLEPLVNSLQQGVMQLRNLRQDTYQKIEKEVVDLALAIARKVICREVEMDKEVVVCVAREALARVEDPAKITIKMNPSDLQFISETKYQLSELIGNIDNIKIEAEDNIQSGGCIIETNLGEIDARIEQQLQAVEESFRSALEKSITETS